MGKKGRPFFRLERLIRQARQDEGSFEALAKRIYQLSNQRIDRRKLKTIADGKRDVSLRISELQALDAYLSPRGESLAEKPLFDNPLILRSLVDKGNVTFLVASKPRDLEHRVDLSRWDVRAMAYLLRAMDKLTDVIHFEIEDVLLHPRPAMSSKKGPKNMKRERWYQLLSQDDGPSLVCIGSPRACHATEVMLSLMFNVNNEMFNHPSETSIPIPFYFIYNRDDLENSFPSRFALSEQDMSGLNARCFKDVKASEARAFKLGDECFPVPTSFQGKKPWEDYGVVVAQRRRRNQVWLAIAGLSGAATLGSALAAAELTSEFARLPPIEVGEPSRLLWAPIKVTVEQCKNLLGDDRIVLEQSPLHEPKLWPPD